jgi:hypothetical protein
MLSLRYRASQRSISARETFPHLAGNPDWEIVATDFIIYDFMISPQTEAGNSGTIAGSTGIKTKMPSCGRDGIFLLSSRT